MYVCMYSQHCFLGFYGISYLGLLASRPIGEKKSPVFHSCSSPVFTEFGNLMLKALTGFKDLIMKYTTMLLWSYPVMQLYLYKV